MQGCPVTFAKTSPDAKGIRGVEGLAKDGKFSGEFIIKALPTVTRMELATVNLNKKGGFAKFDIRDKILTLKEIADAGDWMSNFNASESQLAEAKASDTTPPLIQILSPKPSKGKVSRVDAYTSFVRGKVTDDAGVMNILVGGKKVGVKDDGTFAAKVRLKIGRNDILVQAEDINNNIAEAMVTIVRDEFIPDQTLADVDLPPKTKMSKPDALAVVIGVESYQYVPDATYAYNDAEVFRE